jgi:hypothetical protein
MANVKDKTAIENKKEQLIEMTEKFCEKYLDEDYKNLSNKLISKMSRKRVVPFMSGKIEIWAAAVIYALGSINFLFDKSFKPYASADDICDYFGTNKSTTSQKAKIIRDMFNMGYFDQEFSTSRMQENAPFSKLRMMNGFIVMGD